MEVVEERRSGRDGGIGMKEKRGMEVAERRETEVVFGNGC